MIDKVQKIRKEVARIQLYTQSEVLKQVLDYIDEVQKEPVSEELLDTTQTITYKGEVYTRCYKDKLDAFACKYPMSVPKPSKRYAKYSDVDLTIAIKEGAKWQKEQLKNSAIDATIGYWNHSGLSIDVKLPKDLKEGSKCKILIIKDK